MQPPVGRVVAEPLDMPTRNRQNSPAIRRVVLRKKRDRAIPAPIDGARGDYGDVAQSIGIVKRDHIAGGGGATDSTVVDDLEIASI